MARHGASRRLGAATFSQPRRGEHNGGTPRPPRRTIPSTSARLRMLSSHRRSHPRRAARAASTRGGRRAGGAPAARRAQAAAAAPHSGGCSALHPPSTGPRRPPVAARQWACDASPPASPPRVQRGRSARDDGRGGGCFGQRRHGGSASAWRRRGAVPAVGRPPTRPLPLSLQTSELPALHWRKVGAVGRLVVLAEGGPSLCCV